MSYSAPINENIYRFDDITVDCENFQVQKNRQNISLTPRGFDVLTFLIKNRGRVVEKQEIFESVWKDTFVSDNALTKIIKEIRHALEDPAENPRYIETIPKRGYRFIGEVKENHNQTAPEIQSARKSIFTEDNQLRENAFRPPDPTSATWFVFSTTDKRPSQGGLRSIAVLPFKPLNADSQDKSLEMGMAETLITRLSNLKQVAVRPMSAVRKYTDLQQDTAKAGQDLQVEMVLDGNIQKVGERVRVTVRLISVINGTSLWAEKFDENFTDIFKVQDSIAERVTNALKLRLSKQEKEQLAKHSTDNPEAYELYLQGQYLWHRRPDDWLGKSLSYYEQALEKDPNFALAYVWSAECYITISQFKIPAHEAIRKAKDRVMKALDLDATLAEAHNALAEMKYQFEYDWAGAEKDFQRAIELNPNVVAIRMGYGWFLMTAGRFDEARTEMETAQELDPNSIFIRRVKAQLFFYARQYDQALQDLQKIIAVEPKFSLAYFHLARVYEQKQMYAEAFEALLKNRSLNGFPPEKMEEQREIFRTSGWQGFIRKVLEDAKARAKTMNVSPLRLANIYVQMGQIDMAFAYLERAYEIRAPSIVQLKIEPIYDSLRDDSRYTELLHKIGLQP